MNTRARTPISTFASLQWYDETIKFIFNFAAKTSELLLAAGVVISSANFLTDGAIMQDRSPLSVAWAWAQALAIDSSLGIVFVNGFQAARDRDKFKAAIYFILTVMLAMVAGLLTHFDALSHATNLPVTDKSISGVIPLWVLTALRATAVIGFLLVSRLKNIHLSRLHEHIPPPAMEAGSAAPQHTITIDYAQLATAIVEVLQQRAKSANSPADAEETPLFPLLQLASVPAVAGLEADQPSRPPRQRRDADAATRIMRAYAEIQEERAQSQEHKPISARDLAKRARVRRSACSAWLQAHIATQVEDDGRSLAD
ncbi:hypothetical protein [Thermogemmatispora sp.]|uniref:hypothetical protein n=1 Tax=Thermogemmatispora sp. TaxID=1968838 RepID=UPI001D357C4A|nr:hypothetical protein [Thermogemmatispora sp.]MBX5450166.1 hypothetical protein [Thermogemmatispora sp.]